MEEVKVTREEVIGYNAADGTFFSKKESCEMYEKSARCAAQCAANCLQTNSKSLDEVTNVYGCCEERIAVYDIKNATDLQVLNTWLKMVSDAREGVHPRYVGQKVAIQYWIDNDDYTVLGDYSEMLTLSCEKLDKLFSDPEVQE